MALYTGKGDNGTTYIFDTPKGERISKSSIEIATLGALDELNSFLGMCKTEAERENVALKQGKKNLPVTSMIHALQEDLFIIQAEIAGAPKKITGAKTKRIEKWIADIERELPPITTFFISGGTELAARLDVARTLARRVERTVVALLEHSDRKVGKHTLSYLNRLSSIIYALSRYANHALGETEKAPSYK